MRTEVERTELARILSAVTKVVDTRNTIPLLSHVLLRTDGTTMTVLATDLEIEASGVIAADADPVVVALPGREFADIVKRMVGERVSIELDGDWAVVKSGRSRFRLPTLVGDTFPRLGGIDPIAEFTADLAGITSKVAFATGNSDRFALNGVFLHSDGDLAAVATDGKRLVRSEGGSAPAFKGVILPAKLLANLPSGQVDVEIGAERVRIRQGGLTIVGRLILGTYPDYQRIWPADQRHVVTADRRALRDAVGRVSAISDENLGRGVRVSVAPGGMTLSIQSHTRGEAVEEVPVIYNGEPYDIGFNVGFLSEMLGAVPGDQVEIALGGNRGANFNGAPGFAGCLMYFDLGRVA